MLPTPSTTHVPLDTIYEPSEDSYLFLDTLSSPTESSWLSTRFGSSSSPSPSPLVCEVGTGSGVVLAFVAANPDQILGRRDVLVLGTDVNRGACVAAGETVRKAIWEREDGDDDGDERGVGKTTFLSTLTADLLCPLRENTVDILLFNPPYVPTEELPDLPSPGSSDVQRPPPGVGDETMSKFDSDSYFLSLTYAGGTDGMQTTNRLLDTLPRILEPTRGVAYVLLCRQNRPVEVMERIHAWEGGWRAEVVGDSGGKAGWEKLVIVRTWRDI